MKRLALLAAAAVVVVSASAQGALKMTSPGSRGMDEEKLGQVDRVIGEAISDGTIPGAVISVVRGSDIVYLKAYGNKSLVPSVEPMTTETMFDLASCSKCVGTTLSFMQLIENGLVRLTDRVDMYIPGFKPWVDEATGEKVDITVRDLLTHSSGLDAYINVPSYVAEFGEDTPDQLETFIATRVGRNFRPGTQCLYSCLNFITLQRILERLTGVKLYEYTQRHVFDPLGLKHTCYFPLSPSLEPLQGVDYEALRELCAPTEVQEDGLPLVAQVHDPMARRINSGNSGNAGVFSNAEDLSVICSAIMNGSVYSKKAVDGEHNLRVLGKETIRLMCEAPEQNAPEVGRALGWDKDGMNPGTRGDIFDWKTSIWHTGYTGPSIVIDMKTRTAVILLTNRVHPEDKGSLARLRAQVSNIVAGAINY